MDGEAIITVSTTVVLLTQLIKWSGFIPLRFGPLVVLAISALGVVLWAYTRNEAIARADIWSYFAGWIAVSTSAAGVFGFTRAAAESITNTGTPAQAQQPRAASTTNA